MQDGDISSIQFHKALQEVEKYCKLKTDVRNQSKTKMKQITKEQQEELLEAGNEEGKENFFYDKLQALQVSRVSMSYKP